MVFQRPWSSFDLLSRCTIVLRPKEVGPRWGGNRPNVLTRRVIIVRTLQIRQVRETI